MNAEARVAGLRLTLVIVWMGMTLSACTSLGTRPDREQESAASTSKSTPENEADVALQRAYREYLTWVEVELVPRVESEVKEMMRLGWVRSVDDIDLWHLHIGYPSDLFPEGSAHVSIETLRSVHETAPHHLLYHSMERPHEVRRSWMNALAQAEHKELRRWVAEIEEHELRPVSHRYPPGYHYPVMVAFGPSAEGAPFFGVSHVLRGEELVFGVRALVYADSNPR